MQPKKKVTLTDERRLHAANPLWSASSGASIRTLSRSPNDTYDVVIIGAGISGALMAEALSAKGKRVLVIDRREPGRGSTVASTAMIMHEIDTPLRDLTKAIGRPRAERVWQRSARAVEGLVALVKRTGIQCGLRPTRTLYLAGDELGPRALADEARAREHAGLEAAYIDAVELAARFGIARAGAIDSDVSCSLNPLQLTAGLLRHAQKRGAVIVAPDAVTSLREEPNHVFLATASGQILRANHVVSCTGYELVSCTPPNTHRVVSSWAIASEPDRKLPRWLSHYLVWEASDPYLYMRRTADGRLLAGGEDEPDPEAYRSEAKRRRKAALIAERVSDLLGVRFGKPAYSWSAPFGDTKHGLPLIGRLPDMQRVFAVMGYGGNGITYSKVAAEIVSAAIAGKEDPDAKLFRFVE